MDSVNGNVIGSKKNKKFQKYLALRIDQDTYNELAALAHNQHVSLSELIRRVFKQNPLSTEQR